MRRYFDGHAEADGTGSRAFAASHGVDEEIFPPADAPRIRELIGEFHWSLGPAFDDRIHLDILEICGGKAERARELVELAKIDCCDLIMAAEYEVRDGKVVQNERGKIRLAELHVEKMRRAADGK